MRWQQEETELDLALDRERTALALDRERTAQEAARHTARAERELKLVVATARAQRVATAAKQRVDDERQRAGERKVGLTMTLFV